MVLAIVSFLLCLLIVVGVHETGHALMAWFFGVRIKAIAFGLGPALLRWRTAAGHDLIWALWPLGGYVRLYNTRIAPVEPALEPYCFDKQAPYVRFLILIAGILANLLLTWVALMLVFGVGLKLRPPVFAKVAPGSIVAEAGLKKGDRVRSVGSYTVHSWQDVAQRIIIGMKDANLPVSVRQSDGEKYDTTLDLQSMKIEAEDRSLLDTLGIQPDLKPAKVWIQAPSLLQLPVYALQEIGKNLHFYLVMIKRLLGGSIPFSLLLGPLGFAELTREVFQQGMLVFTLLVAHLSLVVALVNSFPIPGLDGASMLYVLLEKIRGRPISIALEVLLHRLAIIAFAVLLVNLLMNDLERYIVSQ